MNNKLAKFLARTLRAFLASPVIKSCLRLCKRYSKKHRQVIWCRVETVIESIATTPFEMQFFQQPKQLPSRLEGSSLISSQTANLAPLISFSLAGIAVALLLWTSQSFLLSRISPSRELLLLPAVLFRLRKRTLHDAPCAAVGVSFLPILFESLGGLSSLSVFY